MLMKPRSILISFVSKPLRQQRSEKGAADPLYGVA